MNITDKTQANELSQINIPKCYAGYVNTAIASSVKLLTMKEFIDITGFEEYDYKLLKNTEYKTNI